MLLAVPLSLVNAAGLKVLSEEDMSREVGRDGVTFATALNLEVGSYVFTPYDGASVQHKNLTAKGTILSIFDIVKNDPGKPDIGQWHIPMIATTKPLQIEYDLVVSTTGKDSVKTDLGTSVMYKDFVPNGSVFQWTSGPTGGIDLGLATNLSIGQLIFSPNGRKDEYGQMKFDGIKVESSKNPGSPWVMADLKTQSGKFRLPVENGVTRLQLGIDWPEGTADAATGRLSIDKVAFPNPNNIQQPIDLGSSSIGSMQIQYMNIKFR